MKKNSLILLSGLLLIAFNSAMADVLINSDQFDEIKISNTQLNLRYTLKIEEPSLVQETTPIIKTNLANTSALPYNSEVLSAAYETSIEPALIHAVITVESRHNPRALSKNGAYGLMQLMPATAKRFNVKNKNDPQQNILAGAKYLRELEILYQGNINLMLAAYNAGPAAVEKYHRQIPPYLETQLYVPKVLKLYQRYSI